MNWIYKDHYIYRTLGPHLQSIIKFISQKRISFDPANDFEDLLDLLAEFYRRNFISKKILELKSKKIPFGYWDFERDIFPLTPYVASVSDDKYKKLKEQKEVYYYKLTDKMFDTWFSYRKETDMRDVNNWKNIYVIWHYTILDPIIEAYQLAWISNIKDPLSDIYHQAEYTWRIMREIEKQYNIHKQLFPNNRFIPIDNKHVVIEDIERYLKSLEENKKNNMLSDYNYSRWFDLWLASMSSLI